MFEKIDPMKAGRSEKIIEIWVKNHARLSEEPGPALPTLYWAID
jgi:hypothetical protein